KESLKKLDNKLILNCDYRKQTIYEGIKNNDVKLVLNYSQDRVKTMKLINDNGIKAVDLFLKNEYIKQISFNNSEVIKTKVKDVYLQKGKIHLLVEIFSHLLEKVDPQYIKAFILNNNTEIEVPIKNTYASFFEIRLNMNFITEFEVGGINKIKITYKKDELFN